MQQYTIWNLEHNIRYTVPDRTQTTSGIYATIIQYRTQTMP